MDCWNDEIETILDNVRKNAIRLNNYHIKRFYHFKSYGKYFRIPLIFLNSLGSVCSVGLQPYMEQKSISLTTCLIAMLCGLITSLELYLSIQSSMENHLKCAKDFYTLSIDIYKTLELTRDIRGLPFVSFPFFPSFVFPSILPFISFHFLPSFYFLPSPRHTHPWWRRWRRSNHSLELRPSRCVRVCQGVSGCVRVGVWQSLSTEKQRLISHPKKKVKKGDVCTCCRSKCRGDKLRFTLASMFSVISLYFSTWEMLNVRGFQWRSQEREKGTQDRKAASDITSKKKS